MKKIATAVFFASSMLVNPAFSKSITCEESDAIFGQSGMEGVREVGKTTVIFDGSGQISAVVVKRNSNDNENEPALDLRFTKENSTFVHEDREIDRNEFEGECESGQCREKFEFISATNRASGDSVRIKVNDHGLYPDEFSSTLEFSIGEESFNSRDLFGVGCSGDIKYPAIETISELEDDLLN